MRGIGTHYSGSLQRSGTNGWLALAAHLIVLAASGNPSGRQMPSMQIQDPDRPLVTRLPHAGGGGGLRTW